MRIIDKTVLRTLRKQHTWF